MNKRQFVEEVIEQLEALAFGEAQPYDDHDGLCAEMSDFDLVRVGSTLIFVEWPKYSGSKLFPVPHPKMTAEAAFFCYRNLWGDDEYCDDRRELSLWTAEWLSDNIEELIK